MTIAVWDWSQITGTGGSGCSSFEPKLCRPLLKQDKEGGYQAVRKLVTKGWWEFSLEFHTLTPSAYVYLVDFWHAQWGGVEFYFRWPFAMADIPHELEIADPGGVSPWSSEVTPLCDYGPTYLCYFTQDEFPVKRLATVNNYWSTTGTVVLRSR